MDIAQTWIEQGRKFRNTDMPHMALERYNAAANLLRDSNEPQRLAPTIRPVADIQRNMGLLADAESSYAEALAIYRDDPATGLLDIANTLRGYALLREETGDRAVAHAMLSEAGEIYRKVGVQAGVDQAEHRIATLRTSKTATLLRAHPGKQSFALTRFPEGGNEPMGPVRVTWGKLLLEVPGEIVSLPALQSFPDA